MIVIKEHIINNSLENDYSKSVSIEHRKKFAQFFTPFPIADLMAKWILNNKNIKTVLISWFFTKLYHLNISEYYNAKKLVSYFFSWIQLKLI